MMRVTDPNRPAIETIQREASKARQAAQAHINTVPQGNPEVLVLQDAVWAFDRILDVVNGLLAGWAQS